MRSEKRKHPRKPLRYVAWISLEGTKLHGCVLSDISETGAKLDFEDASKFPDNFALLFSSRGTPRRNCRVAWRSPTQMGVHFEKRLAADKVTLVPYRGDDAAEDVASGKPATENIPETT